MSGTGNIKRKKIIIFIGYLNQVTQMKILLRSLLVMSLACSLNGCNLINSLSSYSSTTEAFTNSLIKKDFDKCISLMAVRQARDADIQQLKVNLDTFSNVIVRNFGTKLEYSFMKAEKTFSSNKEDNLPPNTTLVQIEFHGDKYVGVLEVLFDDKTKKIDNIKALDVKQPIPDMTKFWLFGIFAIIVFAFNIYTIIMVKRSGLNRKWLAYIGIILLNVPTIQYHAIDGLFFKLLNFQILLGVSFQKMGYTGSVWAVAIPLGAIIAQWRISRLNREAELYNAEYYASPLPEVSRPLAVNNDEQDKKDTGEQLQ